MIQITPQMRILVAVQPVDFRKGIDGLVAVCRQVLDCDPFSGALFVFRNRRGQALKFLVYDGQGFWICQKRLSEGRFGAWSFGNDRAALHSLDPHQLHLLIWNGDPSQGATAPMWRRLPTVCA